MSQHQNENKLKIQVELYTSQPHFSVHCLDIWTVLWFRGSSHLLNVLWSNSEMVKNKK